MLLLPFPFVVLSLPKSSPTLPFPLSSLELSLPLLFPELSLPLLFPELSLPLLFPELSLPLLFPELLLPLLVPTLPLPLLFPELLLPFRLPTLPFPFPLPWPMLPLDSAESIMSLSDSPPPPKLASTRWFEAFGSWAAKGADAKVAVTTRVASAGMFASLGVSRAASITISTFSVETINSAKRGIVDEMRTVGLCHARDPAWAVPRPTPRVASVQLLPFRLPLND